MFFSFLEKKCQEELSGPDDEHFVADSSGVSRGRVNRREGSGVTSVAGTGLLESGRSMPVPTVRSSGTRVCYGGETYRIFWRIELGTSRVSSLTRTMS